MIVRSDRASLIRDSERLMRWKLEAMEVLRQWDAVADKVPKAWMPLGRKRAESTGLYIEHLEARIAELQAIPPHPAYLPWVKTDLPVIVKTETGWVHVGPEPPVPDDCPHERYLRQYATATFPFSWCDECDGPGDEIHPLSKRIR